MATQAFPTSRKMSRSDSTSASAPSSATRDYVEDYHKLFHCINYCSLSTHCIKCYCLFSYGTKHHHSSMDFYFFTFSFLFCLFGRTVLGQPLLPYSDCDGA